MSSIYICVLATLICLVLRVSLNLIDRSILRDTHVPFAESLVLNSFFPFIYALLFLALSSHHFFDALSLYFFNSYAVLSGVFSYIAALFFFQGFRTMNVRCVVLSAKGADLLIPFALCIVGKNLDIKGIFFSFLTVLSFFPIFYSAYKAKEKLRYFIITGIILSIVITAFLGALSRFSQESIMGFISFFTSLSLWRLITSIVHYIFSKKSLSECTHLPVKKLFFRGCVAFIAQISFTYVTTLGAHQAIYAWPILNSSPLVATAAAHLFIKEKINHVESLSFLLFIFVVVGWIITY